MIEYALLIMLGFCIGGLIAFLLAPTLWNRAVRLTTKRLEATMPMSLSEIEADKDLLRAKYAVTVRRLEAAVNGAREKSANQLVEISKLQMRIGELNDQIAALETQLDERRNAATVFENTIRKRFPEMEAMVAAAKATLEDRAREIADLTSKLQRREETLKATQRAAALQQQEILKLRETLERSGSDATGRFKSRPSQWGLDEYRSEYDRLNVELSKMREQVILAQERETYQISVLKSELQQLGEQILSTISAKEKRGDTPPAKDADIALGSKTSDRASEVSKRGLPSRPVAKAQPWPGERGKDHDAARAFEETDRSRPRPASRATPVPPPAERPQPQIPVRGRSWIEPAVVPPARPSKSPSTPSGAKAETPAVPEPTAAEGMAGADSKQATREALKTLLDRSTAASANAPLPADAAPSPSDPSVAAENARAPHTANGAGPKTEAGDNAANAESEAAGMSALAVAEAKPKLDQVFREIFESRSGTQGTAGSSAAPGTPQLTEIAENGPRPEAAAPSEGASAAESAGAAASATEESSPTRTLLDRLRVLHERQTG